MISIDGEYPERGMGDLPEERDLSRLDIPDGDIGERPRRKVIDLTGVQDVVGDVPERRIIDLPQEIKVATPRDKQTLQQELAATQREMEASEHALASFDDRYDQLSEAQQEELRMLRDAFQSGESLDKLVQGIHSEEVSDFFAAARPHLEKQIELEQKEADLKVEALPYIKEDVEEMASSVLARIDYDAVLSYYGEIAKGNGTSQSSTDFLKRTFSEMHLARKCAYEATQTEGERDFDYFYGVQQFLSEHEAAWASQGFLKDLVKDTDASVLDIDDTAQEKREYLLQEIDTAEKILSEYRHLAYTYRPGILKKDRESQDWELTHIRMALDTSSWNDFYQEHLDDIGLDPRMLDAAERHVAAKILDHRREGRLPKTHEVLMEERQRLDAIDLDTAYDHIAFHGFEPPEGMESVFDKEKFIAQAKKTIPADFVIGLDSIAVQPEKEAVDGKRKLGSLITEFGTGEKWDTIHSQRLEVYKPVFVDETALDLEKRRAATYFWETVDHELGHNGHSLADYDEMKAWEKVEEDDPTAITRYVQDSRDESEEKGKREGFADGAKMFRKDPFLLYLLSEPRYYFMDSYFRRHMPSQQVPYFELEQRFNWQTSYDSFVGLYNLTTMDEVRAKARELYLTHEREDES